MTRISRPARRLASLSGLGVLLHSGPVLACAVCFGDPNSAMTKGAAAGIMVLFAIVTTVLAGIAGVALFWIRRARRLQPQLRVATAGLQPSD